MNEENNLMVASESSHILGKHFAIDAFMSQKSESLPHSFFFDSFSSKVIFRVTQNSPVGSFASPRKPCSTRLPFPPSAPDGCIRRSRLKPKPIAPDGSNFWAFGRSVPVCVRYAWSALSDGQCPISAVSNS